MTWRFLLLVLMLLGGRPVSAATEVMHLQHRLPAELARIVAPLLEPGEAVVPASSALVIKAHPDRIREIRALVEKLDRSLQTLTITVLQSDRLNLAELNARSEVTVQLPKGPLRARGHLYRSESEQHKTIRQSLRIIEGQAAFIAIGQEKPVPVIQLYGFPPQVLGGIEYKPVTSGFRVVPRLVGCRVRLEITPWSQRPSDEGDGSIDTQAVATTVEVTPGQWIELGSHGNDDNRQEKRLLGYSYTTRHGNMRIFLHVAVAEGC